MAYLDRLAEMAKRLTPGVGREVLADVSPELMYAVVIENDRPEHQLLHSTRLWGANIFLASSVGNFNTAVIGQGASEGMISVLTHVVVLNNNLNFQFMNNAFAGFSTAQPVFRRDGRHQGGCATQFYTRQTTQLETGGSASIELLAGIVIPMNYVFTFSGNGFPVFETKAITTPLQVGVFGYERVADKHEVDGTVK